MWKKKQKQNKKKEKGLGACLLQQGPIIAYALTGLEIATDTVGNASTTFNLATKNSSLVATWPPRRHYSGFCMVIAGVIFC